MAQLITVRLSKSDHQPLGFRLQGGKDFGTPLVVQKVCVELFKNYLPSYCDFYQVRSVMESIAHSPNSKVSLTMTFRL